MFHLLVYCGLRAQTLVWFVSSHPRNIGAGANRTDAKCARLRSHEPDADQHQSVIDVRGYSCALLVSVGSLVVGWEGLCQPALTARTVHRYHDGPRPTVCYKWGDITMKKTVAPIDFDGSEFGRTRCPFERRSAQRPAPALAT